MKNQYQSRDAARKAAIADALMQGAMSPTQGGMVGRYYVGEGVGGGINRIGQALLSRSLNKQASAAEDDAIEQAKQAKQAAFGEFTNSVTPHDQTSMEYNGGHLFQAEPKTSKYTPSNKDIASALMKYQSDTGEKVDDSVVKLLAGGSLDGTGDAFGTTIQKNGHTYQLTKTGKLVDLGEGYDQPTRVIDLGGSFAVQNTKGAPKTITTLDKGVSPDAQFKVKTAPETAAAVVTAEAAAKAKADKTSDATSANDALYELGKIEAALPNLPETPVGMSWEQFKAQFTGGDPKVQAAIGEIEQASGRMLKYVERLPGAATDADRQVFMASAGVINDPKASIPRKMAAIQAAKESYQRLIQKYGDKAAQPAAPANPSAGWSYIGAKK